MNSNPQNISSNASSTGANAAEATLQMLARLPAPLGLEDRVLAGMQAAPRPGHVLNWPRTMSSRGAWVRAGWMRGAAAAAIVFAVAGGGWGIYTRVQPSQPSKVLVIPRRGALGGFSGAGAIRTPETLHGPVVVPPATAKSSGAKTRRKTSSRSVHAPLSTAQRSATTEPEASAVH
jgi:hypothetical protein